MKTITKPAGEPGGWDNLSDEQKLILSMLSSRNMRMCRGDGDGRAQEEELQAMLDAVEVARKTVAAVDLVLQRSAFIDFENGKLTFASPA